MKAFQTENEWRLRRRKFEALVRRQHDNMKRMIVQGLSSDAARLVRTWLRIGHYIGPLNTFSAIERFVL
jgi:hypothetical protein